MTSELRLIPLRNIPRIPAGADLAEILCEALQQQGIAVEDGDILVLAHKIVSRAEGRTVPLASVVPSRLAQNWAARSGEDPRLVEIILQQSRRVVRMDRGLLITETPHGFVCAHAGVDLSNTPEGEATLLPEDPDGSARRLRHSLEERLGVRLAVLITDSFGRPWREGLVNVALGVAGMTPLADYRGQKDYFGRTLESTVMARADELAAAAGLLMEKAAGIPAVLVRGLTYPQQGSGRDLIRPPERDLFR